MYVGFAQKIYFCVIKIIMQVIFLVVVKSQKNFQCPVTELLILIIFILIKNNDFSNIPFSTAMLESCLKGCFSWNIQLETS